MPDYVIVSIGLVLNIIGNAFYYVDMFKGTTKPNRITAGLWAFQGGVAVTAALASGVTWAVVPVIGVFLCPLITFVLSFVLKQAVWKLTPFDWACGALSLLGVFLWWLSSDPNIAILFAILADLMAAVPTISKSWKYPDTETGIAYALPVLGYATSFLVLEQYSFAEMAFPLYSIVVCTLISILIYGGRYQQRKQRLLAKS